MKSRCRKHFSAEIFACVLYAAILNAVITDAQTTGLQQEYQQAQRALAEGRYSEAESSFEKLSRSNPEVAEIHANLGLIYFEERKFDQAVPALHKALKLKPSLTKSAYVLALSLSELGHYQEALPGLEKGFYLSDPEMKRMCGLQLERAYTGLKRDNDAVKVALEMERSYPKDPEVQYHDGKIFGNQAFVTMQKLWQADPDSIWRHQAEAEALESQGSYEAAVGQYRDVLARDPQRPGIHYRIGRTLLARSQKSGSAQDTQGAATEFEQELQIDSTNGNAAYELAEIYRSAGKLDDAQKYFEMVLKNHPDFEEAQLGMAATLVSLQKPELALAHLQRAIALNSQNEVSWWRLAQVERALGNSAQQKKALAEFQHLHSQTPAEQTAGKLFSPEEVTRQQVDNSTPQ